jgi:hypothetical protein
MEVDCVCAEVLLLDSPVASFPAGSVITDTVAQVMTVEGGGLWCVPVTGG